jgi:hypothetical protein
VSKIEKKSAYTYFMDDPQGKVEMALVINYQAALLA